MGIHIFASFNCLLEEPSEAHGDDFYRQFSILLQSYYGVNFTGTSLACIYIDTRRQGISLRVSSSVRLDSSRVNAANE